MEYTKEQLDKIWRKGVPVEGYNPDIIRQDACGAWILRESYGHEDSDYCWEVDHICPQSLLQNKGVDEEHINRMENLRPLNRQNNISKAGDYPNYKAVFVANGDQNTECDKRFTVNREVQSELATLYGI